MPGFVPALKILQKKRKFQHIRIFPEKSDCAYQQLKPIYFSCLKVGHVKVVRN